jgi:fimbrial chaperone protein
MTALLRVLPPILALLFSGSLAARDLAISPLRMELPADKAMTVLTITNQGREPVLLQAGVKRWQQTPDADNYSADDAMLVSPALFRLPPGQRQLVRIGWRRQTPPEAVERAYRVFIEEVPDDGNTERDNTLRILLRLVVPLFVHGSQPATPQLSWQWLPTPADSPPQLLVSNHGTGHARITRIQLEQPGNQARPLETLTYVLPNAQQIIRLPGHHRQGSSKLTVTDADGTRSYPLPTVQP